MAEEGDSPSSSSVQPSSVLIHILRRKLRDPNLVPSFERHRARRAVGGLVRPRWRLRTPQEPERGDGAAAESATKQGATTDAVAPRSATTSDGGEHGRGAARLHAEDAPYNTLPARNYIDLRLEQNTMFADAQHVQCATLLSPLRSSGPGEAGARWKERAAQLRALLNNGLAACPDHAGLLRAEGECERIRRSLRGSVTTGGTGGGAAATANAVATERPGAALSAHPTIATRETVTSKNEKGPRGRARAAMQDALLERSFMLDDTNPPGESEGDEVEGRQQPLPPAKPSASSPDSRSSRDEVRRRRRKRRSKSGRSHDGQRDRHRKRGRKTRRRSGPARGRSRSASRSSSSAAQPSSPDRRRRKHDKKRKREGRREGKERRRSRRHQREEEGAERRTGGNSENDVGDGGNDGQCLSPTAAAAQE